LKTIYEMVMKSSIEDEYKRGMADAVIVRADNVARYVEEHGDTFQSLTESFPVVTPPFELMWIEYFHKHTIVTIPAEMVSGTVPATLDLGKGGIGYFVERNDYRKGDIPAHVRKKVQATMGDDSEVRWLVLISQSAVYAGKLSNPHPRPEALYVLMLDEHGAVLDVYQAHSDLPDGVSLINLMSPVMMTLALMHCKNVVIEEVDPNLDPNGQRKKRNRHARPSVRYRIIKIRSMTRRSGTGTHEGDTGPVSFHIRRGHFKDYTQTGLFGRHFGIYWWDAAAVGSTAAGRVEGAPSGSYDVQPPGESDIMDASS